MSAAQDRPPERILVVEDDARLGAQIVETLQAEGFAVRWLQRGDEALAQEPGDFDLVILDLMLPGAHGMHVLERMRAVSEVPILILSALRESEDQVRALGLGADDYVTKPFWPEQLVARVYARLRRPVLRQIGKLRAGAMVLDPASRSVRIGRARHSLTSNELRLLEALLREPGVVCSREALFTEIFETDDTSDTRRLEVLISRLRRKLGDAGQAIATVWGAGYRVDASLLP